MVVSRTRDGVFHLCSGCVRRYCWVVIRLRRATAFALTLLLLQLVLVGSGFTCVTGDAGSGAAMADMGMTDMMDMPGMSMSGPSDGEHDPSTSAPESNPAPCSLPWAPAGCTLMIPCGPHAVAAQVQAIAGRQAASHADVMREMAAPPSAIIALDTPPPRA